MLKFPVLSEQNCIQSCRRWDLRKFIRHCRRFFLRYDDILDQFKILKHAKFSFELTVA